MDHADDTEVDREAIMHRHLDDGVPLTTVAAEAGVPIRTARRWLAAYRAGGQAGLHRRRRGDRDQPRMPAECVGLIEGLALRRPPPTVAHIHRSVGKVSEEQGWPPPSYTSVAAVVAAIDPGLATLAHRGPAAYRDNFELVYRRESKKPNEVWQADHTELDDHSRAVAGYTVFLGAPTSMQTALALRQAIWRKADSQWQVCGLPSVLYSDHGSDFVSAHMEQVCADNHIRLVHSTPGVPQGRGKVERFIGTVTSELLPTLPGHIPHGTHGKPVTVPTLSLAQLDTAIAAFVVRDYHQRVHSETGETPQQRWLAGGWLPRMPESLEQLDLLLLTLTRPRVVHRDGIHCHGLRYLDLTLSAYVGERVIVRYDPRDLAEIRLCYQGRFLCRALSPELADATISLKDLQRARTRRRRELRGRLTERRSLADALTSAPNGPIPDTAVLTPRSTKSHSSSEEHPRPTAPSPQRRKGLKIYRED
ncbi:Mu transposase C-terminal domain-containing protein [Rhodococcus qingshengii]|uniref:Mu transposase C-terminal domain-containing protein n=1 Tax=Rhodococcus qingshengii TaxID=334542 RepID=UPI001E47F147|nr:Mu transposase C-terminal domain-containing protein [Rhodococcus qingshengii]MCD2135923.1 Mu transposase C-terminal domain-containing protein [Rhodococcus qingshengii]